MSLDKNSLGGKQDTFDTSLSVTNPDLFVDSLITVVRDLCMTSLTDMDIGKPSSLLTTKEITTCRQRQIRYYIVILVITHHNCKLLDTFIHSIEKLPWYGQLVHIRLKMSIIVSQRLFTA